MNGPAQERLDIKQAILAGKAPAGLRARSLDLSAVTQPFALPPGLECFSIDLSKSAIEALPGDLRVEFRLNVSDCSQLASLPRGLKVGSLLLSRCTKLHSLPEEMDVNFLTIEGCTALTDWPESARVSIGSVNAAGCTNLRSLPSSLKKLANLDLRGCRNIKALPLGLELSGWLDIADTGISSLPESLRGARLRWRGVQINAQIAFFPETLSATEILTERNAEVRRVMIERCGLENFLNSAKATVLDQDTDAGGPRRLLRVPLPGDEDLACVSIHCPSTGRHYIVRVPPTMQTCRQAIAWTAGYDNPNDYNPIAES